MKQQAWLFQVSSQSVTLFNSTNLLETVLLLLRLTGASYCLIQLVTLAVKQKWLKCYVVRVWKLDVITS
jgi:hypothetical protein